MADDQLLAGRASLPELLRKQRERIPDKVYARHGVNTLTYREIDELSNQTARWFRALGVANGDVVCLMLANSLPFLSVWFGLNKLGAIEFPINVALTGRLLESVLNYSTCRVLVVDQQYLEAVQNVSAELTMLETIVVRRAADSADARPTTGIGKIRVIGLEETSVLSRDPVDADVRYSDVMAIMSTSGTTGQPKGVMLTYHHELVLAAEYLRNLRYGGDDVFYNCLPLFHNIGQAFCALPALLAGASIVIADKFSAARFWADLVEGGCSGFNFMGAMIAILCKQPVTALERQHRVRGAFGLPRPPGISEEFERRFGIALIEGYGQTEASIVTYLPWEDRRPGSCGKAIGRFEVDVVDDDDTPVAQGAVGEIVVRPKEAFTITAGYFNLADETLRASRNLWWHTGDFGRKDADGFFYFVDRKKDVIRRRGETISSAMIERIVDAHADVLESAAVGVPSELSEEDVMVAVIRRPGHECSAPSIVRHCSEHLPRFAVPSYVLFLDELPKTPTGKVQKHLLRSLEMRRRATAVSLEPSK